MTNKQKKDVVINVKPFHAEIIKVDWTGFKIEFISPMGNDYSRRKKIRMEFDWYFLPFLSGLFKKAYLKQKDRFLDIGRGSGIEK